MTKVAKFLIAKFLLIAGLACAVAASGALNAKSYKHGQHKIPRVAAVQQPHVACTVLGCQPIPAVCHPKEEHSPSGIPTGFDQIICPPGVWPF